MDHYGLVGWPHPNWHDFNILISDEIPCCIPALLDNCCDPSKVGCLRLHQLCLAGWSVVIPILITCR